MFLPAAASKARPHRSGGGIHKVLYFSVALFYVMADRAEEPFVQVIAENIESKNPIILGGFPGMGLVGNIVTQYYIEQLDMKPCGRVDSRLFPPIAILYGGLVKGPVRIYENAEKGVIVVFSDIPIDPIISREVGKAIVMWAKPMQPREIVSIAGLATPGEEQKVYGAATTEAGLEKIKDKVEIFEMGTITGVPGVLLNECMNNNIEAICILGETRGPNPDPRSAIKVVEALNNIYDFGVPIEPMKEQAEQIEQMLHKLSEQVGEAEARPSKEGGQQMYG
jgi:uncharacterized protein